MYQPNKTNTKLEATIEVHTHDNSAGTAPAPKTAPPVLLLDSLMTPLFKDLKAAHYRVAAETHEARERAGREFRAGQPGICA